MMIHVILYYYFAPIDEPEVFCKRHREQCESLNLKGRVYIAREGINGTLAGAPEDIDAYKAYLRSLPGFESTQFKTDECDYIPFEKLVVKVRPEIVALKSDMNIDVSQQGGGHLSPEQWRKTLESDEDYVLIDVRNNYETAIGHFEGAMCPDLKNFYDFPEWVDEAGIPKNKKVLMYCTGGIRCEKFSIFMKNKGYEDVKQLHGGIIEYAKQQGGKHFKGKCFVFDDRLEVPINPDEKEPLTRCAITGKPWDKYINCANMDCNKLFLCCPEGAEQMQGCCSEECKNAPNVRPFDKKSLYQPFRKWYRYFDDK